VGTAIKIVKALMTTFSQRVVAFAVQWPLAVSRLRPAGGSAMGMVPVTEYGDQLPHDDA
jgi:hypothetical protein